MGSGASRVKPRANFKWHSENCWDADLLLTKGLQEAAPWEHDMLLCDLCKVWIASPSASDEYRFCRSCKAEGFRLILCKGCHKHSRPAAKAKPKPKVDDKKVEERASQKFWKENCFLYELPADVDAAGEEDQGNLPGAMSTPRASSPVYNGSIRQRVSSNSPTPSIASVRRSAGVEDGELSREADGELTSRARSRTSSRKSSVASSLQAMDEQELNSPHGSTSESPSPRHPTKAGTSSTAPTLQVPSSCRSRLSPRAGTGVSLVSLHDFSTSEHPSSSPRNSERSSTRSTTRTSTRTATRMTTRTATNVSSRSVVPWLNALEPQGEPKLPASGMWSGAISDALAGKDDLQIEAISRQLTFLPDGTLSGTSADGTGAFINGELNLSTGKVWWTEIRPAGKWRVSGAVRFGDGCCVMRGSIVFAGKVTNYVELSINMGATTLTL